MDAPIPDTCDLWRDAIRFAREKQFRSATDRIIRAAALIDGYLDKSSAFLVQMRAELARFDAKRMRR